MAPQPPADGPAAPARPDASGKPRAAAPEGEEPDEASRAGQLAGYVADLLDSVVDALTASARLEFYRLTRALRRAAARTVIVAVAVVVSLLGVLLLCWGASLALSAWIGSPAAGFFVVGAACLTASALTVLVVWKSRPGLRAAAEADRVREDALSEDSARSDD